MYSVSIYEACEAVRESLDKIVRCYFAAKGIGVHISKFSRAEQLHSCCGYNDVVFLDVDNNSKVSIQSAYLLLRRNPNTYLFLMSDGYACIDEAMDLKAFRYLSKNLDIKRIFSSLDIITAGNQDIDFMSNYIHINLKESEIACIFSKERRTIVLTDSGDKYPTILSMKDWMARLEDCSDFLHPHYSYIINKNFVSSFDGKKIILKCKDGKTMDIYPSQRKLSEVRGSLYSIMGKN